MRIPSLLGFTALSLIYATSFAHSSTPSSQISGLDLLKRTSQHYADAKSYDIKAVEERTDSNELLRNWQKVIIEAAEAPDHRYHYEGRSAWGNALRVSDGTEIWTFHINQHVYTRTEFKSWDPDAPRTIDSEEESLFRAEGLRRELAELGGLYKSAARLRDDDVEINGHMFACYVVRVRQFDMKRSPDFTVDKTIWIEKTTERIVKTFEHGYGAIILGNPVPQMWDTTTTYVLTDLGHSIADSLFTFVPPANAKLVDKFRTPGYDDLSLEGQGMPKLVLVTGDGRTISWESLHGKPVLFDFWATWCAGCVKGLEKLFALQQATKNNDLVIVTIDQDEEAKNATDLLAKKGYTWPNVHDDGEITKALGGVNRIPRTILVNRDGRVIYDKTVPDEAPLLKVIASLGSEYAPLAPKPQPPCGTEDSSK